METENDKNIFCKKLRYKTDSSNTNIDPSILLGLLENEDDYFIWFRTARKTYRISKSAIVSIEDTNEIFRENKGDADGY